ncbi:hypothetical protein CERSUDRAFT_84519 [Gelatoporia subvermispora B]|uniref:Uncharacterized protein n=1 Tax=Ceriporiopsis subvermispora (strain B) TaxID=914234 RepID=M2RC67_CERS8|nr:hypothetical protein CERSUDRAFT_84519 [Gelatoporia subvermispora B]
MHVLESLCEAEIRIPTKNDSQCLISTPLTAFSCLAECEDVLYHVCADSILHRIVCINLALWLYSGCHFLTPEFRESSVALGHSMYPTSV